MALVDPVDNDDLADAPANDTEPTDRPSEIPTAAMAIRLIAAAKDAGAKGLLHIATDERRAEDIGAILASLAPELETLVFPPWDCLPYDRASPSRESMGRRMAVLARLAEASDKPRLVITSPEAILQKLPPSDAVSSAAYTLALNDAFDAEAFRAFLDRAGYLVTDRVDEPGQVDIREQVIDVYPAALPCPYRLNLDGSRICAIRTFDPVSQRTTGDAPTLTLGAASELMLEPEGDEAQTPARFMGMEHWLPDHYDHLQTLFDAAPEAVVSFGQGADARRAQTFGQLQDAYDSRLAFAAEDAGAPHRPVAIERLYLDEAAWTQATSGRTQIDLTTPAVAPIADFALERRPVQALAGFIDAELEAGRRVVLAGVERDLRALNRRLKPQIEHEVVVAASWADIDTASAPGVFALQADLTTGFSDAEAKLTVVAAPQVLGSQSSAETGPTTDLNAIIGETDLRFGDTVIHQDHGVGVLRGLEPVEVDGLTRDAVRLDYHGDTTLLVPVEELDKVWRYGAEEDAVHLDHLNTGAWAKHRAEVETAVVETAEHLVSLARQRDEAQAPKLVPPRQAYERFSARFTFAETPDQTAAIRAVLADLASGRPMDRLICGDVGFGKTEIALRAAAACALAGKQVAIIAPTTVLARQHVQTFQRRFAGTGLEVAHISRLASPAEVKRVKAGLASGDIRIVVGTHALAADSVQFADLGLLVIDEEQRFGAKLKAKLRAISPAGHVLTLTATPIPRTLQMAMVGVQDISVIATPPARRRPIRTFITPFDPASVRSALVRERARGGQSFLVVPRISDIEPMKARLTELIPDLKLVVAHGELPAEEADAVMVGFADGRADVLLATNIIESGLDVPRANTMLVWRPDRFGLAQLHQLRGRVGRGRSQGVVYLLDDPEEAMSEGTRTRLHTLEAFDRLGAGLAISARDLDLRGAGDLVGDDQAGHMKLIGLGLYQELLARAVQVARGETVEDDLSPEVNLELGGRIPEAYVPEADVRVNLYARLSRLKDRTVVKAFEDEIENRFGAPPAEMSTLFALARLRLLMRQLAISKISAGPKAIALTFPRGPTEALSRATEGIDHLIWKGDRLVVERHTEADAGRIALVEDLLEKLAS
ncbi:MAG: transcription-repair coupling factor [Caulobacteraceae bacterium]